MAGDMFVAALLGATSPVSCHPASGKKRGNDASAGGSAARLRVA